MENSSCALITDEAPHANSTELIVESQLSKANKEDAMLQLDDARILEFKSNVFFPLLIIHILLVFLALIIGEKTYLKLISK